MSDPVSPPSLPSGDELARLVMNDGGDPAGTGVLALPTVPAGSPLLRMLRRELEDAVRAEAPGSSLQVAVQRVLRGESGLRELLADPAFPKPPESPSAEQAGYLAVLRDDPKENAR